MYQILKYIYGCILIIHIYLYTCIQTVMISLISNCIDIADCCYFKGKIQYRIKQDFSETKFFN